MRYKIEFDLPDNDTVLECIGSAYASWGVWGYSGYARVVSVDAERKTGKWVKVHGYCTPGGDPVWCCSECGKGRHVYGVEHGSYGADVADGQWVACPNCMAIMEGTEW